MTSVKGSNGKCKRIWKFLKGKWVGSSHEVQIKYIPQLLGLEEMGCKGKNSAIRGRPFIVDE